MSGAVGNLARVAFTYWWLVLLSAVVAGAVANVASRAQTPTYEASTTLVVGRSLEPAVDSRQLDSYERLARTYADLARRQPVLQGVVDVLGLDVTWQALRRDVRVNPVENTGLFEIVVESESPEGAEAIAAETAQQLIRVQSESEEEDQEGAQLVREQLEELATRIDAAEAQVDELEASLTPSLPDDREDEIRSDIIALQQLIADWETAYSELLTFAESQTSAPALEIFEPAQAASSPIRPRTLLNTVVAGLIGLVGCIAALALWERPGDRIRSAHDLSDGLGLRFLGAARRVSRRRHAKAAGVLDPAAREDYRIIRSNIQSAWPEGLPRTIMVTSMTDRSTATAAANLGVVMAQAGLDTILVDAVLKQPVLHEVFGVSDRPGLTDFLRGSDGEIASELKPTGITNLRILPRGTPSLTDNTPLLDSPRIDTLLENLRTSADVIIFDSPPALASADAVVLAKRLDGVVFVVEANRTRRDIALRSMLVLERAGARFLGGVLSSVPNQSASDGYHIPRT